MSRVTKDPEERREEIVKTARKLFVKKGYSETTVGDIVKAIGAAQGTFYYYFSSKEQVIDAIVDGYITEIIEKAIGIMETPGLTPLEKIEMMAESQREVNMKENRNIHIIKGVDIHERVIARLVKRYAPLLAKLYAELVRNKGHKEREVLFMTELFLAAANHIFDPGIFQWSTQERADRLSFVINFMEDSFGVKRGSLIFYRGLMGGE